MKALRKNVFREISNTKSRFLSIMAIIALSTGFFSGVKATSPSMIATGKQYFRDNNLMNIRLVSTVGFDDDDIQAIKDEDCTKDVMPGYMSDLIISQDNIDTVVRVFSLPERTETNDEVINQVDLTEGRLPSEPGECVIESYYYENSSCKLGDKIVFNSDVQGRATKDYIRDLEYTITGVVKSPIHITYQRGNTNVGDGSVSFFIMVPSDEFVTERYTNVYVTTTASDASIEPYTDEYNDLIDTQKKVYTELSEERIKNFNETTLKDAQKKLSEAKEEYEDKKTQAEKELSDGAKKLYDGEKELQEKLIEAGRKIEDGEKELADAREKLKEGKEKYVKGLTDAKDKLADAQKQYNEGLAEYEKGRSEYDAEIAKADAQLTAAENEFQTQYSLFYSTTKPQAEKKLLMLKSMIGVCEKGLEELNKSIEKLYDTIGADSVLGDKIQHIVDPNGKINEKLGDLQKKAEEYERKIEDYKKQYDEGSKQLSDGEAKLLNGKKQLEDARQKFNDKKAEGAKQLAQAKLKLDDAARQIELGKFEYENGMSTGKLELEAAQQKITEGEKELDDGKKELEKQKTEAMQQLKEGREKLISGRAEAASGLKDAEQKLSDAQKSIDGLKEAKWYVYTRDDYPGYSTLEEDAMRIDDIAAVFPVFFLLVAALVCLTTMTRMVEERRTEIGTLKALGYSNISIAAKYFIYAALATIAGSIIGVLIGIPTLPFIIIDAYSMMYTLPPTMLVIPWDSVVFSVVTGLMCTCMVAIIACFNELKIKPATLMRPKAPKPGKRILLEYITPIWSRMNFTSKVTARNIFRYKVRFLMTVLGVAGCTALIVGGMGLKDSLTVIADRQYKEISIFDEVYSLSESGTAEEKSYIMSQFHKDKRFSETLLVSQHWTEFRYDNGRSKIEVRYIIGENDKQFEKMFILRDRMTHEKIELENSGIVINERLGDVLGVKAGDKVTLTIEDEPYTATVTGLTENYAGNFVYMTPEFFSQMTGKSMAYNLVYVQVAEDEKDNERVIANEWMQNDDIVTVSMLNEQVRGILDMLESLNFIVFVLVLCAGMLAMVVLYNLTNINIAERVREIATIKVLGFYNMETANYIYRENTILTLSGALVGLPLGRLFTSFIMNAIQMNMVMFPEQVNLPSYIVSFLLTITFSLIVNFIMYFKMKNISMVESLKSIE